MAKLDREARRRERRDHKNARKEARRDAAATPDVPMREGDEGEAPAPESLREEMP